jgi:hypothetical protein
VSPVAANARWILTAELPDGAITISPGATTVWPYIANMAATGLARATLATGDPQYVEGAWRWLAWYQAHEDALGVVTDYHVVGNAEQSTGTEDSTDAYAGTFLSSIDAAYAADPDLARLAALRSGIAGAVRAIEAVQDVDGLTFAKPGWPVKYLMDQSESYAGLLSASVLWSALGDSTQAEGASNHAARVRAGVASLWDPADAAYDWALHGETGHQHTDWAQLYPDALEQVWAVGYGLAPPAIAAALVAHFGDTHPNWAVPTAVDDVEGSLQPVGYQSVAGLAFAATGDAAGAANAAVGIEAAADASGRAWPFTPGDAGELIMLETPQFGTLASPPTSRSRPAESVPPGPDPTTVPPRPGPTTVPPGPGPTTVPPGAGPTVPPGRDPTTVPPSAIGYPPSTTGVSSTSPPTRDPVRATVGSTVRVRAHGALGASTSTPMSPPAHGLTVRSVVPPGLLAHVAAPLASARPVPTESAVVRPVPWADRGALAPTATGRVRGLAPQKDLPALVAVLAIVGSVRPTAGTRRRPSVPVRAAETPRRSADTAAAPVAPTRPVGCLRPRV